MSSMCTCASNGATSWQIAAGSPSSSTSRCPTSSVSAGDSRPSAAATLRQCATVATAIPGSGSSDGVSPSARIAAQVRRTPSSKRCCESAPGERSMPAQNDTTCAPRSRPRRAARAEKSMRRSTAAASRVISVGSCLWRGSSRKRAPVSITGRSDNFASSAAIASTSRGVAENGSRWQTSGVSATAS